LAPPFYTEEIPERVDFRGNALKPIDVEAAREAIKRLKKKGVESVAVCFLFSFLNPDHELKIKELFAREFPEARLSLSYEVLPQIREFYRLSTTVINWKQTTRLRKRCVVPNFLWGWRNHCGRTPSS